jgi:hypothetical protein
MEMLRTEKGREAIRSTRIKLKTFAHKGKEIVPRVEQKILQQGFHVLKELLPLSQRLSQKTILFIDQSKNGMEKKSQQVQTEQQRR